MKKSYKEYLTAIRDVMEFFDSDECQKYGESYWKSKSGEVITVDVGYFWEGLEGFRDYLLSKAGDEKDEDHPSR